VLNAMHGNGGLVFLKEEMLESIVERLTEQVEGFRALKNKEQSDTK
jgi:hypothetical protein